MKLWDKMEGGIMRNIVDIKSDVSKVSLKEIEDLLSSYSKASMLNPIEAATFNQRYKELTGSDYPKFKEMQSEVLDDYLRNGVNISVNGQPSIYRLLKNNLENKEPSIEIITDPSNNFLRTYDKIIFNVNGATLEEVEDILNHYGKNSVVISGLCREYNISPTMAYNLNRRYKMLTGNDHPNFSGTLNKDVKKEQDISVNGISTNKMLVNGEMKVAGHEHILCRRHFEPNEIVNLTMKDLDDLEEYINTFNGEPILIDGVVHHCGNDPVYFSKLNDKYRELTHHDNKVFMQKAPKVISELLRDKEILLSANAYNEEYFAKLEQISDYIKQENNKVTLLELKAQLMESTVRNNRFSSNSFRKGFSNIILISTITVIVCLLILVGGLYITFK